MDVSFIASKDLNIESELPPLSNSDIKDIFNNDYDSDTTTVEFKDDDDDDDDHLNGNVNHDGYNHHNTAFISNDYDDNTDVNDELK